MLKHRWKIGFTLIELMVAVSVLSVGTVLVLRSRLGVISALHSSANQVAAWQFLENKMSELERTVREEGGIEEQLEQGDILLGVRQGNWTLATTLVELDEIEMEEENASRLYEAALDLSWKEENKEKHVALVSYLPKKPEVE